ncbi:hypothetical protein [Pectobacterium brasiliense]|uniref:hypothetical protein n=1 Tax=Pectobacterium brasiliense TaxID=180957 RepID=UPI0019D374BF|nr:hypothetical protein [Pectobacterium brasiliense]MBN7764358.1 hypothetical protein [Pectobacterium brasiliense]
MSGNKNFIVVAVYNYLYILTNDQKDINTPVYFIVDASSGNIHSYVYHTDIGNALFKCYILNNPVSDENKNIIPESITISMVNVFFDKNNGIKKTVL